MEAGAVPRGGARRPGRAGIRRLDPADRPALARCRPKPRPRPPEALRRRPSPKRAATSTCVAPRRDGLGQDRGLPGGRWRNACASGPPGAGPFAGNRADRLRFSARVEARFGARPARMAFRRDARRRPPPLLGAPCADGRGASWSSAPGRRCSCPSRDLGLIVVDEEHDGVLQAGGRRDPVPRAGHGGAEAPRCADAAVVLASATPSLESCGRTPRRGRYARLDHADQSGSATAVNCRDMRAVDICQDGPAGAGPAGSRRRLAAEVSARD